MKLLYNRKFKVPFRGFHKREVDGEAFVWSHAKLYWDSRTKTGLCLFAVREGDFRHATYKILDVIAGTIKENFGNSLLPNFPAAKDGWREYAGTFRSVSEFIEFGIAWAEDMRECVWAATESEPVGDTEKRTEAN